MSTTLSLRVPDDIADRLEEWARETDASKSALGREALLTGMEEMDGLPYHLEQKIALERAKERHEAERRAGWFRTNFSEGLKEAFERGLSPAEYRESVKPYLEEAAELGEMPESIQQETGHETYLGWAEGMIEYYRAAYQGTNFEHDPIDNPLGQHEGIDRAQEWYQRAQFILSQSGEEQRQAAQLALNDGIPPEEVRDFCGEQVDYGKADSRADALVTYCEKEIDAERIGQSSNPKLE